MDLHLVHEVTSRQAFEALRAAGFTDVACWLEPKQVSFAEPRQFIGTVCLVRHLDAPPERLKRSFVDAVLAAVGERAKLDYVRLNITARKP